MAQSKSNLSLGKSLGTYLPYIFVVVVVALIAWRLIYLVTALNYQPSFFVGAFMQALQLGSLYALIALGYTMVYGIIRLINFAQGRGLHGGGVSCRTLSLRIRLTLCPGQL